MKIYTKTGDKGMTSLASGDKISKSALRIEAYGNIDELNAFVGNLADQLRSLKQANFVDLLTSIAKIQNELFDVGSELAVVDAAAFKLKTVDTSSIARLEQEIDMFTAELQPLRNFILPGGHLANSSAHICRTICRRAERCLVRLSENEHVRQDLIIYVNRLSDWLFVCSRYISKKLDVPEVIWKA